MAPLKRSGAALLAVFCLLAVAPGILSDGWGQDLDEVIEGFDDESEAAPGDDLDSVLEGFDDESEAAPDDDLDSVLEGFDPEGDETAGGLETTYPLLPEWLGIDGYLKFGTSYNVAHEAPESGGTDWRGFSRLRTELRVDLDARFSNAWRARVGARGFYDAIYTLRGREEFTEAVRDEYEDEVELWEVYLLGRLTDDLDLKAGRQIVVWGNSDNIRVTDVLNPLDMREPGLTDIEDLRLPVTMTKLDYYVGDWNLSAMAIHEIRFDKTPVYGHDFYAGSAPRPPDDEPAQTLENTEWALSLGGIFSGWDIDVYYARIFNDTPHIGVISNGPPPTLRRKHARLDMVGIAYNKALGNWLLKTEAAFFDGLEFFNRPNEDYSRLDMLIGVEYSGFKEATLSLEFADRHIFGYDEILATAPDAVQEDMYQSVVRYTRDFRNDTLTLTLLAVLFGPAEADGAYERISLEYDLTDTVELRSGAVLYQSGDLPNMRRIGDNDRLFFEVKYHF